MRTVLIVEDDADARQYLTDLVESEGWHAAAVADGLGALRTFLERPIDAALLDVRLAPINGFQVAEKLRKLPGGDQLPIIMVTGVYRGTAYRAEATRRFGLVDFVFKPIDGQHVVGLLKRAFAEHPERSDFVPTLDSSALVVESLSDEDTDKHRMKKPVIETATIALGSLSVVAFPRLLHQAWVDRLTGSISLAGKRMRKIVYFAEGRPCQVKSNLMSERLGRVLLSLRAITPEQLAESIARMKREHRAQGEVLLDMGVIEPGQLRAALAEQLRWKLIDLFRWRDGTFRLYPGKAPPPGSEPIDIPIAKLILRGVAATHDRARLDAELAPYFSVALEPTPGYQGCVAELGLGGEDKSRLIDLCAGELVGEMLAELPPEDTRLPVLAYTMLCLGGLTASERMPTPPLTES
jgi:DNA-binding response OmpR family regulator